MLFHNLLDRFLFLLPQRPLALVFIAVVVQTFVNVLLGSFILVSLLNNVDSEALPSLRAQDKFYFFFLLSLMQKTLQGLGIGDEFIIVWVKTRFHF